MLILIKDLKQLRVVKLSTIIIFITLNYFDTFFNQCMGKELKTSQFINK
jgi:hypothetical protein